MKYLIVIDKSNKEYPVVFRKVLCTTHDTINKEIIYACKHIKKLPKNEKIAMIQHYLDEITNGTFRVYE